MKKQLSSRNISLGSNSIADRVTDMWRNIHSKKTQEIDIHVLISSQRWNEVKDVLTKHKQQHNDVQIRCNSKINPLQYACCFNPPLNVIISLNHAYPESIYEKDRNGNYPLHTACTYGCSPKVVRYLVDIYPEAVKKTNRKDRSPFLLACKNYTTVHNTKNHKMKRINRAINGDLRQTLEILSEVAPMFSMRKDYYGMGPMDYALQSNVDMSVLYYIQLVTMNVQQEMEGKKEEEDNEKFRLGFEYYNDLKKQHESEMKRETRPKRSGAMAA